MNPIIPLSSLVKSFEDLNSYTRFVETRVPRNHSSRININQRRGIAISICGPLKMVSWSRNRILASPRGSLPKAKIQFHFSIHGVPPNCFVVYPGIAMKNFFHITFLDYKPENI